MIGLSIFLQVYHTPVFHETKNLKVKFHGKAKWIDFATIVWQNKYAPLRRSTVRVASKRVRDGESLTVNGQEGQRVWQAQALKCPFKGTGVEPRVSKFLTA